MLNMERKRWLLVILSALLQIAIFPIAGPVPAWRSALAYLAVMPLLAAVLGEDESGCGPSLRSVYLLGYVCGVIWYAGNCYWICPTMNIYGNLPLSAAFGVLMLYSLILANYHAIFCVVVSMVRRRLDGVAGALLAAPVIWVAVELARTRITGIPWDMLGTAQVDNLLLDRIAPWTSVCGMSFVIVAVNALLAGALLLRGAVAKRWLVAGLVVATVLLGGGAIASRVARPEVPRQTAVLLQENLEVGQGMQLRSGFHSVGEMYQSFERLTMQPPIDGYAAQRTVSSMPPSRLIVWPESPAPFEVPEQGFMAQMESLARYEKTPIIAGAITVIPDASTVHHFRIYNSAAFFAPDGTPAGRYDKIHLVPWGEYIPYRQVFFFARTLTDQVEDFERGTVRNVFRVDGHTYGTFICYESVFPDEVRHFAANGAQVLVNISNDGWYGDTSAPWQHLNMARMRAIENHRWILRDANTGVTGSIDPEGRLHDVAPRHERTALVAGFNYEDDVTFYSRHGDLFAWACLLATLVLCGTALVPRISCKSVKDASLENQGAERRSAGA
jgi:apolipoprotein N-acyltransferase